MLIVLPEFSAGLHVINDICTFASVAGEALRTTKLSKPTLIEYVVVYRTAATRIGRARSLGAAGQLEIAARVWSRSGTRNGCSSSPRSRKMAARAFLAATELLEMESNLRWSCKGPPSCLPILHSSCTGVQNLRLDRVAAFVRIFSVSITLLCSTLLRACIWTESFNTSIHTFVETS